MLGRREAEDEHKVPHTGEDGPLQSKCVHSDVIWMARAVPKFLLVICYSELTTSLESTQSFSYLELPNSLFMWFSLSEMPSLRFYLFSSQLIPIFRLSAQKQASFLIPKQEASVDLLLIVCNTLLLSHATHYILSYLLRIVAHYVLTVL